MKRIPKPLRHALPLVIIAATIAAFAYFFVTHPALRHVLSNTSWPVLVLVGALYALFVLILAWVYDLTLQLCGRRISYRENLLLTAYSTIVNFFGPLQSGPGVRAVYLKQRHRVQLRAYLMATLLYYAIYAVISALFLFIGSSLWWLALPAAVLVAALSYGVIAVVQQRLKRRGQAVKLTLSWPLLVQLSAATLCQLLVVAVIYFTELSAVHSGASFRQAVSYGGAANFALFVSLTPGAIGFREAFLEFSQRLHHISTTNILAASLIDRAVFVTFLGLLFLVTLAVHARERLRLRPDSGEAPSPPAGQ